MSHLKGLSSFLWVRALPIIVGVVVGAPCTYAQTLTIRLLNGKSGRPIKNKNVTVRWSSDFFKETVVRIGKDGVGHFDVLKGESAFSLDEGPRDGKNPDRVAFLVCNQSDFSDLQIQEVLSTGFVPRNECSSKTTTAKPGEIVFWGLTLPWWLPDMAALDATKMPSATDGIIPASESALAGAEAIKLAPKMGKGKILMVNVSGRGDKDIGIMTWEMNLSRGETVSA